MRPRADRAQPRWLGLGGRQRPRHSHRHPLRGRRFRRRSDHDPAACRRQVREHLGRQCLQGFRRAPRRRRFGGQCPVRMAGADHLARWRRALDEICPRRCGWPAGRHRACACQWQGWLKKGTRVTFLASSDTFKNVLEFDFEKLEHRYRELAFLNSGVHIQLRDKRHEEVMEHDLYYEGGIAAFVAYLDRNKAAAAARIRSPFPPSATASASMSRWNGTTAITKTSCASPTTSPSAMAARIWRPSAPR